MINYTLETKRSTRSNGTGGRTHYTGDPTPSDANKWSALRALVVVRKDFGLSGQAVAVLEALLSFFPSETLSAREMLMVFPSNRKLCERAHGISEATLRRHLMALVKAGLILRKDSPNGKRYASRNSEGTLVAAYGFSLAPFLEKAPHITAAAQAAQELARAIKFKRGELTIAKRECRLAIQRVLEQGEIDLALDLAESLDIEMSTVNRTAGLEELQAAIEKIIDLRSAASDGRDPSTDATETTGFEDHPTLLKTSKLSADAVHIERHKEHQYQTHVLRSEEQSIERELNLNEIMTLCPSIKDYASGHITCWRGMFNAVDHARKCMGIHKVSWARAATVMGSPAILLAICTMLNKHRLNALSNPGGYLTHLSKLHLRGELTARTMLKRLRNKQLQLG